MKPLGVVLALVVIWPLLLAPGGARAAGEALTGAEQAMLVELLGEGVIDLIGGARNARPDRRDDALDARAERQHRRDRLVGHPRDRAAPPGVRGGDHPRLAVGEQHRGAIGGDDANHEPRGSGDERIGAGPLVVGHGFADDHRGRRMDLVGGGERGARQDGIGGAAAVGRGTSEEIVVVHRRRR